MNNAAENIAYQKEMSDLLKKIFMPTLLLLGLVGNLLSIYIFGQASMKKYTTFRYLTFISILDLCALYTGCGFMMLHVYFEIDVRMLSEFACKLASFLVYFFTHASSMLLALMSVDRTVAITVQMGKTFSTPRTALKIFIVTSLLIVLLNSHFLFFARLIEFQMNTTTTLNDCGSSIPKSALSTLNMHLDQPSNNFNVDNNSSSSTFSRNCTPIQVENIEIVKICYAVENTTYFIYLTKYFIWIDLCFYAIIPFIIMVVCSIIIIWKIFNTSKKLKGKISKNRSVKNKQLLYILFTTNCLFICMVLPLVILNAFNLIQENTIFTTLIYILAYANHALNFIFYGISCEKYHEELFKLLNKLFKNNIFKLRRRRASLDAKYETVNFETVQTNTNNDCEIIKITNINNNNNSKQTKALLET